MTLYISGSIGIYIYNYTLYDDNPQLTPTTLGPFRGSTIQAPSVFFPLGGELPEFVPELRVAWMCEGVNNFPRYWCVYIYIYTCACVFYICYLYILCYIYICVCFFCIIEYYIYICCIWSNICINCIKYIVIKYNTYYIIIYTNIISYIICYMHYYIHNRHCYKELSCTPDDAAELTTVYSLYPSCFCSPRRSFSSQWGTGFLGFPSALRRDISFRSP